MTLLTILFLAGLFADLPEAILGAIVIWAVSGMIDPGGSRSTGARSRSSSGRRSAPCSGWS